MKISIIGAGSAQFSLGLIRDVCLTEYLQGALIHLMDIDEDRLKVIYTLANRYVSELGVDRGYWKTMAIIEVLGFMLAIDS